MELLDFYKELYHKENDRRNDIEGSLNIPILIITTLSTVAFYFITNFDYKVNLFLLGDCLSLKTVFITGVAITVGAIILSVYWLRRAFVHYSNEYDYSGIPYLQKLHDYYKELVNYYQGIGKAVSDADEHFNNYLKDNLVKHIDHNMYVNDNKRRFIYKCKKILVVALITTLITSIPFGINYFKKDSTVYKVDIFPNSNTKK